MSFRPIERNDSLCFDSCSFGMCSRDSFKCAISMQLCTLVLQTRLRDCAKGCCLFVSEESLDVPTEPISSSSCLHLFSIFGGICSVAWLPKTPLPSNGSHTKCWRRSCSFKHVSQTVLTIVVAGFTLTDVSTYLEAENRSREI